MNSADTTFSDTGRPVLRVALLTLEALASAEPVRRFVAGYPERMALVALSYPFRPQRRGMISKARRILGQSGLRLLPYLIANFVLPHIARWLPRRRGTVEDTPLAALCAMYGIPVETVADMNNSAFHDRLKTSGADIILTFHCDQILTVETTACLPRGGLNVHAGLLPDHRGPTPTIHAMLTDPPTFGVTIHRLAPSIDAGAILARAPVELPASTTALAAARHLHEAAIPMVIEVLDAIASGTAAEYQPMPLPYRGFPTAEQLRTLRRKGRSAAAWSDMLRALRTPV